MNDNTTAASGAAPASLSKTDIARIWRRVTGGVQFQPHEYVLFRAIADEAAALATPVQVAPPGWQPIKTAPERGIILLGLAPNEEHEDGYVSPGYWMESDDDGPDNMGHDAGFVDVHFDFFTCARSIGNPAYQHKGLQPTHWMPLPPAPGQVAPQDDARDAAEELDEDERNHLAETLGDLENDGETTTDYETLMDWAERGFLRCTFFEITQEGWDAIAPAAKPTDPAEESQA